jgi:hypothetical protein
LGLHGGRYGGGGGKPRVFTAGPTHQIKAMIFQPQKGAKIRKMKKPEVGDSRFVASYHASPLEMTLRRADLNTQSGFCALLRLFCG